MELHYIYENNVDTNDPILRKICEFCSTRNITVSIREFSSVLYEDDQNYITHLPAIHMYIDKGYVETIYPDSKPIQFLKLEYDKYELELLERESKKQIWEAKINHLRNLFRSLKTDSKTSKSDY
jgi:CRISPR/Cas system CSM-associated protein Csm4 (group 5 of RAMP superfamily)